MKNEVNVAFFGFIGLLVRAVADDIVDQGRGLSIHLNHNSITPRLSIRPCRLATTCMVTLFQFFSQRSLELVLPRANPQQPSK